MNVISLHAVRDSQVIHKGNLEYQQKILKMNKLDLLTEMMRFQEEHSSQSELNVPLMIRGRILFKVLEVFAETRELKLLARSYAQHLDGELRARADAKNHPAQKALWA